jgi:hypothetical protein
LENYWLTIGTTGCPQANKPPWHEPRRTWRWSRRPSRSWWPLRRLRCSSHARRLWWPPWWLPTQRWRLPRRLPWRSWRSSRRLQPILSNDQREQRSTQRARFEAVACRHYAVSHHAGQRFRRRAKSSREAAPCVFSERKATRRGVLLFSTTTTIHACAIALKR